MSRDQYVERSQLCFAMAHNHRAAKVRKDYMQRASWLWLFVWAGMFE